MEGFVVIEYSSLEHSGDTFSLVARHMNGCDSDFLIGKRGMRYLEVVNDFLLLYARNELGSDASVNIPLVAMYLKSNRFALMDSKVARTRDGLYGMFSDMVVAGSPVWRFLNLRKDVRDILERQYMDTLRERRNKAESANACLTCLFYDRFGCNLGVAQTCHNWKGRFVNDLRRHHSATSTHENLNDHRMKAECPWKVRFDDKDSIAELERLNGGYGLGIGGMEERFPLSMFDGFLVSARDAEWKYGSDDVDAMTDFGRVFNGLTPYSEENTFISTMNAVQVMYGFMCVYVDSELGGVCKASLERIGTYAERHKDMIGKLGGESGIEKWLEDSVVDDSDSLMRFVERKVGA